MQTEIDQPGMPARPPADRPAVAGREIDGHRDALVDVGASLAAARAGIDQRHLPVQPAQRGVGGRRAAPPQSELADAGAAADDDAEGARADLGEQRPLVACRHLIEDGGVVGDQPGEHVEPAGRALRVGERGGPMLQRQALQQRHDVDASLLQHRARPPDRCGACRTHPAAAGRWRRAPAGNWRAPATPRHPAADRDWPAGSAPR